MAYEKISGFSDEIAEAIDTQFRVLNKLGIRYFEVRGVNGKNISELNDEELAGLKAKMEEYQIKVSSIGSPVGKIELEKPYEDHFAMFKRVVYIAKYLGTGYIRMFSFYHAKEKGDAWSGEERAEVLRRLREMIAYAREQDVVLLHENERAIYGDNASRCLDLMKELGCDHFKAVFDPANFVHIGQDTREAYAMLKDYVVYMHIKDAVEEGHKILPAGHGDGNIEYILGDLLAGGYDGYISLEPHLGSFAGLAQLEHDDALKDLPQGGEGTFTLAHRCLSEILDKLLETK